MKQAGCILALIMILLFPFSVFAEAEITEVFFIPEQGFIRVKAQIPIPAGLEQVNFTLFPQAHITALWIPSLTGYEISRTGGKSVITVLFQPDNAVQVLELSYEGFMPDYQLEALDQNSMWYPKSEQLLARDYQIKITLSGDYVPKLNGELIEMWESTFSTYNWFIEGKDYPIIWFTDTEGDLEEQPNTEIMVEDPERVHEEIHEVMPEEIAEAAPIDQDTIPNDLATTFAQFDEAVSERNREALEVFIHEDFPSRNQFINYLIMRPDTITKVSTQVVDFKPVEAEIAIYAQLYVEQVLTSQVHSLWLNREDKWYLASWSQIPAEYQFESQLEDTEFLFWIEQLRSAVKELDLIWLDHHITYPKLPVVRFLQSIHTKIELDTAAVCAEQSELVILGRMHNGERLKLVFTYYHDGQTWKVSSFSAQPIY